MAMIRCSQGHFFDNHKYSSCPWCGTSNLDLESMPQSTSDDQLGRTVALGKNPEKAPQERQETEAPTVRLGSKGPGAGSAEGQTVAVFRKKVGIDPVVGWLVCIEGADKGRDYRIHAEKNSVGRSDAMDIVIKGDETISREHHAYVVFNPKKRVFRVHSGEGRGLIYVNDDEVIEARELAPYDIIEMGQSKFCFVPFCCDRFDWKGEKEND